MLWEYISADELINLVEQLIFGGKDAEQMLKVLVFILRSSSDENFKILWIESDFLPPLFGITHTQKRGKLSNKQFQKYRF